MAELLVMAKDHTHVDPDKDRRGSYKRGFIVEVREDGAGRGNLETLPDFVWINLPGVSKAKVVKYMRQWDVPDPTPEEPERTATHQRRRWRLRWADLPAGAQNLLQTTGEITIGPSGDYTWAQVKQFFRNDETGQDETEDV